MNRSAENSRERESTARLGTMHPGSPPLRKRCALLRLARQYDAVCGRAARDSRDDVLVERIAELVVHRARRRGAHDDDGVSRSGVDPHLRQDFRVGLEIAEIDLLLQSRIPAHLAARGALPPDGVQRKRFGQEDAICETEGQVVCGLMLVVHRREDPEAKRCRRCDLRVRVVRHSDIGTRRTCPTPELANPVGDCARLRRTTRWTARSDLLDIGPMLPRQLERLSIVPRRHEDGVARLLEPSPDRREQERVRRIREVDPDPHAV